MQIKPKQFDVPEQSVIQDSQEVRTEGGKKIQLTRN